ncbi:hypothetical protein [Methylomicrobium album]|uniref:Uncharacterized protein n=1 Tax=Methylomicrobium album BG8 TaxID=686340 RepID=H8GRM9_METAL|nr:hypothetical protein [Methylomicrobium album]EIC27871.1 hypothetical protein Metal_4041 [Methylomicrobium album BG8]
MSYIENSIKYPNITDLVNAGGGLNIEYTREMEAVAVAFDKGGMVWEGKSNYPSIEALLEDAEQGIGKWIEENW